MNTDTQSILKGIRELAAPLGTIRIMEVCGTHTNHIRRFGIPAALPENIRLVSGPGCPVCVTPASTIKAALSIADRDGVIFTSFGDMLRVPCKKTSLSTLLERGRDIRVLVSPMDALTIALENPDRQVVWFGIGFETTAPHTAALIEAAERQGVRNLSVLCAHKTMPEALRTLLKGQTRIHALLCPGHVAAITGAKAFRFVAEELALPAAVAGFTTLDILGATAKLVGMVKSGEIACVNMYPRAVTELGNRYAQELMNCVFEPDTALWRGLGEIMGSGLSIARRYEDFDAMKRFYVPKTEEVEPEGCLCAAILRGEASPEQCRRFKKTCTPDSPAGPCMVSSEGSCFAAYQYGERLWTM